MKRDKWDQAFSILVRARAEWRCERCGKQYHRGDGGLECSHLVGRANHTTRWLPIAAVAHCHSCHMWLTARPLEFREWIKTYFNCNCITAEATGLVMDHKESCKVAILRRLTRVENHRKWTKAQKAQLYQEMRAELKRLEEAEAGRGEFFGFSLPTAESVLE